MNKQLFSRKNCGELILKGVSFSSGFKSNHTDEYVIDYAKDIVIQEYNDKDRKESIIIVFTEFKNSEIDFTDSCKIIEHKSFQKCNLNNDNYIQKYVFEDMRLCYKEELNSHNAVTEFMFVFCSDNMKTSNVKKEINNILDRRQRQEIAYKIDEYNLKQLELIKDNLLDKLELKSDEIYNKLKKKNDKQVII